MGKFKAPPRDLQGGAGPLPQSGKYQTEGETGCAPLAMAVAGQNAQLWERSSQPGPVR